MGNTLTVKGQVTLPKRVREHLHLKPGDQVDFEIRPDGEVVVRPEAMKREVKILLETWEQLAGAWQGPPADQFLLLTRGPPDETSE